MLTTITGKIVCAIRPKELETSRLERVKKLASAH
jgi:hypothetical protein